MLKVTFDLKNDLSKSLRNELSNLKIKIFSLLYTGLVATILYLASNIYSYELKYFAKKRFLLKTTKTIAYLGRGILTIDESNTTAEKRLESIGLDNTEANKQAYRQLLLTTPGLGDYISGSIIFEETFYQSTTDRKKFVDVLRDQYIVPGIKVDKGLVPLPGSNNES
ncbi:hypothetical protein RND71_018075 [Anisodus tanguticus]|uniref:fructose-bisphosphate aldolase n=1 Tax=Anisodus tanguticus TaxID=243964 RepID=A0AAE1S1W4_9SOLA|nr:hypothetical protein RND71_018075 [Anisodus tanguticus]